MPFAAEIELEVDETLGEDENVALLQLLGV